MKPKKRGPGRPRGVLYPQKLPVYDTAAGIALLHALAQRRGISAAAMVRQLVREEAQRVGLPLPQPEPNSEGGESGEAAAKEAV
jgi:hypothetical protein